AVCDERGRIHGLDLSTKHVADDSREPENKKPQRTPGQNKRPDHASGCITSRLISLNRQK
ncbi:hypothetical protein EES00_23625, partial [Salmonella enterica subsp. enterica serovar Napoli]|nr:hypothetical protein [Salmonella enterica subsp. enterica serovar Napoli]EBS1718341.1 hypothetical protein [Salmonella enterica subsp. enterica serovar Napoli]EDV5489323.1 hypothetical protein [Salmonella enterica subsp. enterica]